MGHLPAPNSELPRQLDEQELQRVRELVAEYSEKGGDVGFLFYAWLTAAMLAAFVKARNESADEMLLGPHRPLKKRIHASAKKLLDLDAIARHDGQSALLSQKTREELKSLVARVIGEVSFEGYPDRYFVRKGAPVKNYPRYLLVPALLSHLDGVGSPRIWTWDWLTRWCEVVESTEVDAVGLMSYKFLRALDRKRSPSLSRIYRNVKVLGWKKLDGNIQSWWQETAIKATDDTRRALITSGLVAYPLWVNLLEETKKITWRILPLHEEKVENLVKEFGLIRLMSPFFNSLQRAVFLISHRKSNRGWA